MPLVNAHETLLTSAGLLQSIVAAAPAWWSFHPFLPTAQSRSLRYVFIQPRSIMEFGRL